jgi:hypothetical protein
MERGDEGVQGSLQPRVVLSFLRFLEVVRPTLHSHAHPREDFHTKAIEMGYCLLLGFVRVGFDVGVGLLESEEKGFGVFLEYILFFFSSLSISLCKKRNILVSVGY